MSGLRGEILAEGLGQYSWDFCPPNPHLLPLFLPSPWGRASEIFLAVSMRPLTSQAHTSGPHTPELFGWGELESALIETHFLWVCRFSYMFCVCVLKGRGGFLPSYFLSGKG